MSVHTREKSRLLGSVLAREAADARERERAREREWEAADARATGSFDCFTVSQVHYRVTSPIRKRPPP